MIGIGRRGLRVWSRIWAPASSWRAAKRFSGNCSNEGKNCEWSTSTRAFSPRLQRSGAYGKNYVTNDRAKTAFYNFQSEFLLRCEAGRLRPESENSYQPRHRSDRSFRLRQIHISTHSEPHARNHS